MGTAFYIVLEKSLPDIDTTMSGKCLAIDADNIAKLCRKLKVKDFWDFTSENPDELAEFFETESKDWEAGEKPPTAEELGPEEWFPASKGLKTIRALLDFLDNKNSGLEDTQGVIEDLKDMERILNAAEAHGIGWHMEVSF